MTKSSPAAPDPVATADAQSAANVAAINQSAIVNRTNTSGPTGTTDWSDPNSDGVPTTQTTTLSPQQQAIFNTGQANSLGMGEDAENIIGNGLLSPTLNTSNVPQVNSDFDAADQQAQNSTFAREQALLQPVQQAASRKLSDQLDAQGIPVTSEGGQLELNRLDTQQGLQNQQTADDAIAAGNALQVQQFGQSLSANQNQFGQDVTAQQTPYKALAAMLGAPSAAAPSGQTAAQYQVQPADIAGLTQQNYATGSANAASNNQAQSAAASMALMAALAA